MKPGKGDKLEDEDAASSSLSSQSEELIALQKKLEEMRQQKDAMEMSLLQFRDRTEQSHEAKVKAEVAAAAQRFKMRGTISDQLQMIAEMKVQKVRDDTSLMDMTRARNSAQAALTKGESDQS
eukprot:6407681-Ditylum_brightwellii.AAC.1